MMPKKREWGRLTPAARAAIEARGWPKVKLFAANIRNLLHIRVSAEHHWAALTEGDVVPWRLIVALAVWFRCPNSADWAGLRAEEIVVPGGFAEKSPAPGTINIGFYKGGWKAFFDVGTRPFPIDEERSYCQSAAEVMQAAAIIVEAVGRHTGRRGEAMSDAQARKKGEQVLRRSCAAYGNWLLPFWKWHRGTVMFGVAGRANHRRRSGASVILPLTAAAYRRYRQGALAERDLRPGACEAPSPRLLLSALMETKPAESSSKALFQAAQAHCGLYQLAGFCPRLETSRLRPTLLSFPATAEISERLKAYGFRGRGAVIPGFDKPVMELAPPHERDRGDDGRKLISAYEAMCAAIRMYQSIYDLPGKRA